MLRRFLSLAVLSLAALPLHAQTPLAVTWSTPDHAFRGVDTARDGASDPGALRGRTSRGACRSTVTDVGDLPVVVRFDSTETTLAGRGTPVVNAVGTFPGSAWDVSDPDAPRRLNLLFRELTTAQDTTWTPGAPGEPLLVMASSYDGTGTSYAGRNLALQQVDCLYALFLEPVPGAAGAAPFEMFVEPSRVWPVTAVRPTSAADPFGATTVLTWESDVAEGDAVEVRRVDQMAQEGPVVAVLPLTARTFTDTGYALDGRYRYRIEVVDAGGARRHASPLTQPVYPEVVILHGSDRLTLRGALDTGRSTSDIWGTVGPDGREYALMNSGGLTVIDVTDPTPVEVAHVPGGGSDIEAYGRYVYVTGDTVPVQVIDLADPAAPVLVREFRGHPDDLSRGVHTLSIAGDRLYLNGNVGGFSVWSLADPAAPSYLGGYREGYVHDLLARGDTVYAALIGGEGIHVIGMADPTQPTRIAAFNYPGSGAHNICSTTDGRYLFVGDEVGTGQWTRVFDVSDLDDVELVTEIIVEANSTVHNCHVVGDLLFLAHYQQGVRVWNVADPTAPVEAAFYNEADDVSASGIWTVWPHLPSGRLLASDIQNGLLVLELDGSVAAEPTPSVAALSLAPNPTAGRTDALVTLGAPSTVALAVYDVLGRRVATVADADLAAGAHRLRVPTAALPAGVYVVRLAVDGRPAGTQTLTVAR